MTKISEIRTLPLDDLRPIVQRALALTDWPGDWPAAGLIFNECCVQTNRMPAPPHNYQVVIMGITIARGIAASNDPDPLVAIFRAYVLWKAERHSLKNRTI